MKTATAVLICYSTFGAVVGLAQTLTSTFQFTASGFIGTPATATTPFQGQMFTNSAITITASGNTANRQPNANTYCLPSDSATVSISGIGTFQFAATAIMNSVELDPIKGVLGNSIYFYASSTSSLGVFCGGIGPVAVSIQGSTAWNMLSSFGPFQTNINLGGSQFPMATSGGTLQFNNNAMSLSSGTFKAAFTGTPPAPILTRKGVLSHIAAGGGWTTVATFVNTSSSAVPVTVALHNDDGSTLSLPVTTTQQGSSQTTTSSSVSATINPDATLLISMGGQTANTVVGWADVTSTGPVGGFAIFRETPTSGLPSEGTVPLQSTFPSSLTLPYDNTAGFVMGVALANLSTSSANVTATMWDDSGILLGTQIITIAGSGHTAFVLPTELSLTTGRRGIVQFQSAATGGLAGIGLRFSPFGTFTSVPIM